MPEIESAELSKRIRQGELSSVYYIYGRDVLTVENATKAIFKKRLGKDWRSGTEKLDGAELDVSELADKLEICPMLSDCNAILVNDLNAEDLTADKLSVLIDAVENIPDFTLLVFNITGFDVKKGKKTFSAKNKKLTDTIMKKGTVCHCGLKTAADLSRWVVETAQKSGCIISKSNAEKLCEYCLMDSMQVTGELKKLCDYKMSGEITLEDIDALVSSQMETDSFKLAKSVIAMNADRSFVILDDLLNKRNEPVAVLSAISMSFTDLYRARAAVAAGRQPEEVIVDFGYKGRDFAVRNAFRDCRKISLESFRKCICILRDTDRQLKQTGTSPKIALQKALTQMLMAAREK